MRREPLVVAHRKHMLAEIAFAGVGALTVVGRKIDDVLVTARRCGWYGVPVSAKESDVGALFSNDFEAAQLSTAPTPTHPKHVLVDHRVRDAKALEESSREALPPQSAGDQVLNHVASPSPAHGCDCRGYDGRARGFLRTRDARERLPSCRDR